MTLGLIVWDFILDWAFTMEELLFREVQFVPLILMLEVVAQVGLVLPLCQELGVLWEI
jgi:hypothetical protein